MENCRTPALERRYADRFSPAKRIRSPQSAKAFSQRLEFSPSDLAPRANHSLSTRSLPSPRKKMRFSYNSPSTPGDGKDRFVPCRPSSPRDIDLFQSKHPLQKTELTYDMMLRSELLRSSPPRRNGSRSRRLLFDSKTELETASPFALSPVGAGSLASTWVAPPRLRRIPLSPFKVLDAPGLKDDFYLNLIDWSAHNVLAVGLKSSVYLWSALTSRVIQLCDLTKVDESNPSASADDSVTSLAWTEKGDHLAVGTSRGHVQVWDARVVDGKPSGDGKLIRTFEGHKTRVGALDWSGHWFVSGSRGRDILVRDVRCKDTYTIKLEGHKQEVCGLKWASQAQPGYDKTLASGGNDNKLLIWDVARSTRPIKKFSEHNAAVKAISWSPHEEGLIASGGGTADRHIRFWSTLGATSKSIRSVDTGSQVCNLQWSRNVDELVSTHGYSLNQIVVWKHPSMAKISTLTGHTYRVLYLALSPDGQNIVTGAGDETLRFWNVFPESKGKSEISGLFGDKHPDLLIR